MGGESERPAGAGTPPACKVFFAGGPVVSLVPRSTTGYRLGSLRDQDASAPASAMKNGDSRRSGAAVGMGISAGDQTLPKIVVPAKAEHRLAAHAQEAMQRHVWMPGIPKLVVVVAVAAAEFHQQGRGEDEVKADGGQSQPPPATASRPRLTAPRSGSSPAKCWRELATPKEAPRPALLLSCVTASRRHGVTLTALNCEVLSVVSLPLPTPARSHE